ncbi:hypothetical protein PENTCL1PPCAC_672, partial [Pristionchus entomophagus]
GCFFRNLEDSLLDSNVNHLVLAPSWPPPSSSSQLTFFSRLTGDTARAVCTPDRSSVTGSV